MAPPLIAESSSAPSRAWRARRAGPVPPERRDAIYRQLIDQLVALKLLSQECVAQEVVIPETEVEGRLPK